VGPLRPSLLLLPLLLSAAGAFAADGTEAHTETAWGLHSSTFDTLHGRVVLTLGDDAALGDTLSGRVRLEPDGQDEETRTTNLEHLGGYTVLVAGQRLPASSDAFQWKVPVSIGVSAAVGLLDEDGARVGETAVPLRSAPGPDPYGFELPTLAQAGRPVSVSGPFGGDLGNTGVTVGGAEAPVLAESPRKLVALVPADVTGPAELVVTESGTSTRGEVRVVGIRLSAPKVDLKRGERTTLTVRVSGLAGLKEPIPLEVVNLSPSRVRVSGGETQTITIPTEDVDESGEYTWTTRLTGVAPGSFQITAFLPDLARPAGPPETPVVASGPEEGAAQEGETERPETEQSGNTLCVYRIDSIDDSSKCPRRYIRAGFQYCVKCPPSKVCPRSNRWVLFGNDDCKGTWTLTGGTECRVYSECPGAGIRLFQGFEDPG
jgi:hypothetical protein